MLRTSVQKPKKLHRGIAAGLSGIFALQLSACGSPVPVPASYPLTYQQKVESAAHWQIVAADMWQEASKRLEAGGYHETMVGLESPAETSEFSKAMDNFLMTEIVSHGVAVSPSAEFTLTYDVQIVHYSPDRDAPAAPFLMTGIAGAGALAGAGYEHGWGVASATAAGVPLAAAADVIDGWTPSDSSTEMVLTMSVIDGDSVRIRESKVYYINDADARLYEGGKAKSSTEEAKKSTLVSSNWYASEPQSVVPAAMSEQNQFGVMIDQRNGPVYDITGAIAAAAAHCGTVGMDQAKYISQGYPSNDRTQIKVLFECF